jgi:hypothetical protein
MGVTGFEVYPTCDIHLLLDGPGGAPTTYQLLVRDRFVQPNGTQTDLTTSPRTTITFFPAADGIHVIDVSPSGVITPVRVGETFCRIRHDGVDDSDPQNPKPAPADITLRVRVHEDIDDLWIGNNLATLYRGEAAYVLTVYAHFTDGTIGDVSSHPYLRFGSPQPTRVRVNDTDDKGRLTGVAETPPAAPVPISVSYKALSRQVDVWVGPPMTQPRPILECIHGDPRDGSRSSLLILPEGFTTGQEALFRHIAGLMIDRLFQSQLNAPFPLLKESFNVWVAFDPSSEEGITPGSPLSRAGVAPGGLAGRPLPLDLGKATKAVGAGNYHLLELVGRVGFPDRYRPQPTTRAEAGAAWATTVAGTDFSPAKVEDAILDHWLTMRDYHLMQAKDSRFAIMQGIRHGDRVSLAVEPAVPVEPTIRWYLPHSPVRGMNADRRRLPRNWTESDFQKRYIDSLRVNPAKHGSSAVFVHDVVVYLANCAYDGGTRRGYATMMSVRNARRYLELHLAGRLADHTPTLLVPTPSLGGVAGTSVEEMASVLAHELGHGFWLGDEYDGFDYAGSHDVLKAADTGSQRWVQTWLNLTHHHIVHDANHGADDIEILAVKWRHWLRTRAASVLTDDATPLPGNRLRVPVPRGDRSKWLDAKSRRAPVFLRTQHINPDDDSLPYHHVGPLEIATVQADGVVILKDFSSEDFLKGHVLYEGELVDGRPLSVLHPEVLHHFETRPVQPFAKKADATVGNREPGFPPAALAQANPAFHPVDLAAVVGVYEGGGTFNTKVYRSSGICKMRDASIVTTLTRPERLDLSNDPFGRLVQGQPEPTRRFVPFCYVCQYALANRLNPTRLDGLVYPR